MSQIDDFMARVPSSRIYIPRTLIYSTSRSSTSEHNREDARKRFFDSFGEKADDAFQEWVDSCSTTDQAKQAFNETCSRDRSDLAFKKWLSICSTIDEAKNALNNTCSSERRSWARERIRELGGEV